MADDPAYRMGEMAARAEAFLLAEGGPLSRKKLAQLLAVQDDALDAALHDVAAGLEGTGISLVQTETEIALATAPRASDAVRQAFEDALGKEIGSAGLEVLAIVLYRGPSTRANIDYIRGVNTSSTVRLLLSRGLLERAPNPADAREYLYRPTTELLAHLGVRKSEDLPDYATIRSELAVFEASQTAFDAHDGTSDTTLSD